MLAEAIHSFADTGNQALLLIGGKRSRRQVTKTHPFGFGRQRYVYAFVVAVLLFSVGGLFSLREAWHKYGELGDRSAESDGTNQWWWVPLVVLGVAIVLESFSFRTAIIEGNKERGDRSWWRYLRDARAPELPVILLEDFAALMGLVFALGAVILTLVTGNPLFDIGGTALIGLLLVVVAVLLAIEINGMLVGESATSGQVAELTAALAGTPGVERVIHMKTLHTGPDELLVTAKIAISEEMTGEEIAQIVDQAEVAMRTAIPSAVEIFIEPDIFRANYSPRRKDENL